MSFFYDFLKNFDAKTLDDSVRVMMVFLQGVMVVGDVKIEDITAERIVFLGRKHKVVVCGENLFISSIAKGEIFIRGNVKSVGCEDM